MGVVGETPVPGFIRDAQKRAAAAAKPTEIAQAPSTRAMTSLVMAGWDYEVRMGQRIWKKDDPDRQGGFWGWYGEEVAVEMQRRFDEREES